MVVTLFPDGIPCVVKEETDLSFLHRWGRVFRVFDRQDSGNLCFGLEREGRRYFLKYAGARPLCFDGEPSEAVRLLEKSAQVIRDLAHPALLPLLWDGPVAGGYALLFPWTDALCMGKQYPTRAAFLALPVEKKLAVFQAVLAFHRHVAERGYVSVDFYDGCVMYEEETGRPLLCDVDAYHRTPFLTRWGGCGVPPALWLRRSTKREPLSMNAPWCTPWVPLLLNCFHRKGGSFPFGLFPRLPGSALEKRLHPSGKTGIPHCAPWKKHGTGPWGGCKRAGQVLVKSAG